MTLLSIIGPATVPAAPRPLRVVPEDIAAMAGCTGVWIARPEWMTINGGGFIQGIINRVPGGNHMNQLTAGRQPMPVFDAQLNRVSAKFLDTFNTFMSADLVDYTGPFSMGVVFKSNQPYGRTFQPLIGSYGAAGPERAFISLRSNKQCGALYGSTGVANPGNRYFKNEWQYAVCGYDGTSKFTFQLGGNAPQTITITAEPTAATNLMRLGHSVQAGAAFGDGFIDQGLSFTFNLFDAGKEAELAGVRSMVRYLYRNACQL